MQLNGLLGGTQFEGKDLDNIVLSAPAGPLFNNAAQIWNHTFFWNSLSPNGGGAPSGPIAEAIEKSFGSFDAFKVGGHLAPVKLITLIPPLMMMMMMTRQKEFNAAALNHFGSGWAWLVKSGDGLKVVGTHDAGNPLRDGTGFPLLTAE